MKFSGREDIEAPIAAVWGALVDFDSFELLARRKGAEVSRIGVVPGVTWKIGFTFRGQRRNLQLRLVRMEGPNSLTFEMTSAPAEGVITVELIELGPNRTRLMLGCEIKPRTLAARLFIQSLKLARARLNRRFALRLSQLAQLLEAKIRTS